MKKTTKELILVISLAGFFILAIYYRSLFLFFAQDDFYLLAQANVSTLKEFLNLLLPQKETVWYRPLSQYLFFFAAYSIFGLKPFLFHLIIFITHLLNTILVYLFLKRHVSTFLSVLVGVIFYAINNIHHLSLSWFAAYGFVLGPTFFLLTLLLYPKRYYFSLVTFFLSLMAIEINIVLLPAIIGVNILYNKKKQLLPERIVHFTPFFIISGFFLLLRFVFFPTNIGGAYSISIVDLPNSLRFYLLRFFSLSEYSALAFGNERLFHLTNATGLFILGFLLPVILSFRRIVTDRSFYLGFLIFTLLLLPFLFLPFHRSAHYLSFALIGGCLILSVNLSHILSFLQVKLRRIYSGLIMTIIVLASLSGNSIEWQHHWLIKRAHLARYLVDRGILVADVGSEEYFALGANYASYVLDKK